MTATARTPVLAPDADLDTADQYAEGRTGRDRLKLLLNYVVMIALSQRFVPQCLVTQWLFPRRRLAHRTSTTRSTPTESTTSPSTN